MVSLYYRKVSLNKLETLLENRKELIEDLLCEMIYEDLIPGKIDRLTLELEVLEKKSENEVVDQWIQNINQIVDLVDFVTERIEREDQN